MTLPKVVRRHWADTLFSMSIASAHGALSTLLPPMFRDEGKGPVIIGSLVAVSALMALLMRLPGGLLYSPARARLLLLGSLVLTSVAALGYPLATDNTFLTLIGAVDGIGYSAATTVNLAAMIESIGPDESRPQAMSFFVSGMSFGFAISAALWSVVAQDFGFQAAFWGMVPVYGCAALLVFARHWGTGEPRLAGPASGVHGWRRAQRFGAVLLDPGVTFIILGAFFVNVFLSQFQTFMPLTLLPLGISLAEVGMLRSIWSLTNALGRVFGGTIVSRLDHHRTQNGSLILESITLALFFFPMPLAAYVVVTVTAASGRAFCYVANAVALSEVDPARVGRGVASGIMNAAGDLGNILGPVTGGIIAGLAGYSRFWLISPPLYLAVYFGLLLAVNRRGRVRELAATV